ncbi:MULTISPECIES: carbohydrate ABC transporter permease [Halorussus]|uniref:carbohydrate ABC transporter permease n=1 Tax=Halorussus TaxID=1070314 RepID=UPI000E216F2D|nr:MULTISPECIES: carbohydrate ABC transporter permease [Halorussus]NHN58596.1 carbohydrate ABC transporter permease [Halorussus sp. JP-T4]
MSNPPETPDDAASAVATDGALSYRQIRLLKRAGLGLAIALVLAVVLFPILWMFHTSLRPQSQIFIESVPLVPEVISLVHYRTLLFETEFPQFYANSIVVSLGVVSLTVVLSTLGGYGLARLDFRFKRKFARLVLFGYMFPAILLSIPMFIIWTEINLTNNLFGLVLAETALSLPFSLWLMWQFFQTVPRSLEESARTAGATRFQAFKDVAIPLAKPGMIAVALFSYAVSWNEYTIPKVLMSDRSKWPLTVGLFTLSEGQRVFWGQIMAASIMIVLPAFVFVIVLRKYLLEGFRTGL